MIDTPDPSDTEAVVAHARALARTEQVRITQHAHQEMVEEGFTIDDVLQSIATADMLENYPAHRRGPCCLLGGVTAAGRNIHLVCTATLPVLIIITVYEPKPPKWATPTERSRGP